MLGLGFFDIQTVNPKLEVSHFIATYQHHYQK